MPYPAEPTNPAPVATIEDLQRLYATLRDLDARIAAGRGNQTVAELREELLARYLAQHSRFTLATSAALAGPLASAPSTAVAPPISSEAPHATQRVRPVRPPRPAFSWQAFLAEQAIAIMAHMGGFLLLVATLTFEVGAWQILPDVVKLVAVCAVYLVFGGLGFALRRSTRLGTVGRAYLGVFALMTPLVVLAAYRFQFQAAGVPPSGILCVGSLYAAAVYLILAQRTRFVTYAYLGSVALVVATLAAILWFAIDRDWWPFALASVALVLLLPGWVRRFEIADALGEPAMQVSAAASVVAVLGVEILGSFAFSSRVAAVSGFPPVSVAAITAAACLLVLLAVGWRLKHRQLAPRFGAPVLDTIDVAAAAFTAQAFLAIALWMGAETAQLAYVLAALGLAELGAAMTARLLRPQRRGVRYGVEGIALTLLSCGVLLVATDPSPNWPFAAALSVGVLIGLGIAITENAPWWLLVSGFCLTLDSQVLGTAVLPPSHLAQDSSALYAALTLVIWAIALALGLRARLRRFAAPVYVVALGDAVYTATLLTLHPNTLYQTAILLTFVVAAFIAARREQQPLIGGIVVATFGVLATLPFAIEDQVGWEGIFLALALAVAAVGVRRVFGRAWALPFYVSGVVAAVIAAWHAGAPGTSTVAVAPLGIPLAGYVLLIFAALTYGIALWEGLPLAMVAPAVFALWAVFVIGDNPANLGLVFVFAGAGAAARRWRGPWWSIPLHVAAVAGSAFVVGGRKTWGHPRPTGRCRSYWDMERSPISWHGRKAYHGSRRQPHCTRWQPSRSCPTPAGWL